MARGRGAPSQPAIGLMSGTSLDGVDAALIVTDGQRVEIRAGRLPSLSRRRALAAAPAPPGGKLRDRSARPGVWPRRKRFVTEGMPRRSSFLAEEQVSGAIAFIGFHGHTVLHRPAERLTWQIGDGATLARRLGFDVVYDFRAADVAAGGEGAPLVPLYHARWRAASRSRSPFSISAASPMSPGSMRTIAVAFDTGPGNALIDDFWARAPGGAWIWTALSRAPGGLMKPSPGFPGASLFRAPAAQIP